MLLERVEKQGRKAEVSLLEVRRVGGAIHPGKVEHEVRLGAEGVQLFRRVVDVIFVDFFNMDVRTHAVLAVTEGLQVVAKRRADHALRAGDEDVQRDSPLCPYS